MSTKERILRAALILFNKQGVSAITVRDIAKETGISHGNLCYHYPTVNDIILALHAELSRTINETLDKLEPNENLFQAHADAIKLIFAISYKYKFFFLHLVEIEKRLPAIRRSHMKSIEQRKIQVRYVVGVLKANGLYRSDLPDAQYESFIDHCFLYADSWISHSEVMYTGSASSRIAHYVKEYLALFMPYLTEKGKQLALEMKL